MSAISDLIRWGFILGAYLAIGGLTAGAFSYASRDWDDFDQGARPWIAAAGLVLWPVLAGMMAGIWISRRTATIAFSLGAIYGHRLNAEKIARTRGQMLQDDLERVGGNFDLVVNYEYGPCGRCFGAGCAKCDRLGVVRTKRGVAA